MKALMLYIILVPIALLYSFFAGGFIFSSFWQWFIVPVFNIQALSVIQAGGIAFTISFFKIGLVNKWDLKNEDEKLTDKITTLGGAFIAPWILYVSGFVLFKLFM